MLLRDAALTFVTKAMAAMSYCYIQTTCCQSITMVDFSGSEDEEPPGRRRRHRACCCCCPAGFI